MEESIDEKFPYSLDVMAYYHFVDDILGYREVKTFGTII
jgi:hypothetical protein